MLPLNRVENCCFAIVAAALALSLACGNTAAQTGAEPEARAVPEAMSDAPLGDERYVCARYDPERANYTGTVAVLERADVDGAEISERAAYRLLVISRSDGAAPREASKATPTGERVFAMLEIARAAQREGRAAGEEHLGHAVRAGNSLRFTSADGRTVPKTMMLFTNAGVAIIESVPGRPGTRIDGPYRCARDQARSAGPLLPERCAETRTGNIELDGFAEPSAEVTLIQTALDRAGMAPGPIDGILGPRTLGALVRWSQISEWRVGRIVVYEVICPLIDLYGAEQQR